MFIRFSCPHCKRGLKVKQELAGKRVKCAACQQPVPVPTAPPPTAATPAHAEELAAQVFGDEPPPVIEAKPEGAPIAFKCYFCDEDLSFPADLAGKQAPCPSCRRIIKVPLPVKQEPKDWRKTERRGPSAAKENFEQPAPEGTWSTASKSSVSQQALIDADILIEEEEPLTWQEKTQRGLRYLGIALIATGAVWGGWHLMSANRQDKLFHRALQAVEGDAHVSPEIAVEVHRLAGEYFLRTGEANQTTGDLKATEEFRKARGGLTGSRRSAFEHDAEVIDLALSQIDLGAAKSQTRDRSRLKWDQAQTELRQTLQKLSMFEARAEALRLVTRKLIVRSQESEEAKAELRRRPGDIARLLSTSAEEAPELLAIVGLEVLKTDRDYAEELARDLLQPYEQPAKQPADAKQPALPRPPFAPSLVALLLALNQDAKAAALLPPSAGLGWAVGMAHQGKWDRAQQYAAVAEPNQHFQVLVAVADAAQEKSPEEAKRFLTAAFDCYETEHSRNIFWPLRQLAGIGARMGQGDAVEKFLDKLPPGATRSEAQLAAYRARPVNAPVDLSALNAEAAKKTQTNPRLISFLARRIAYQQGGSAVQKAADSWNTDAWPLGYMGAALGMQDAALGSQQVAHKK